MTDKKVKPLKQARSIEENAVEALQKQLLEAQQKALDAVTKTIESIEQENKVGIGVQLDIKKLTDVITYMIANNKSTISLKFEVWKT